MVERMLDKLDINESAYENSWVCLGRQLDGVVGMVEMWLDVLRKIRLQLMLGYSQQ